jgi:acetyltransferase-like isoleucine patch superfamily enzyme
MLDAYISAAFQLWAADKTNRDWRWFWRLKKLGIQWQLKKAQKIGSDIELTGPVIINNLGTIEIGNQVRFTSKWYKPIFLNVTKPGAKLIIEDNVMISYGTEISIANEVVLAAYSGVSIDCLIYDTDWHKIEKTDMQSEGIPTRIGRGAWLGARVMVLKGVTIGENSVIAANSLVNKNIPDNVLAGGIPARVIRPIKRIQYNPPDL